MLVASCLLPRKCASLSLSPPKCFLYLCYVVGVGALYRPEVLVVRVSILASVTP